MFYKLIGKTLISYNQRIYLKQLLDDNLLDSNHRKLLDNLTTGFKVYFNGIIKDELHLTFDPDPNKIVQDFNEEYIESLYFIKCD
jgi:hypothetical protein